jgi:hypothetical protein
MGLSAEEIAQREQELSAFMADPKKAKQVEQRLRQIVRLGLPW